MDLIGTGIDFFQKGGPVMYLLLLCSIFVVVIAIERMEFFRNADAGRSFAREFSSKISNDDLQGAVNYSASVKGFLPEIIKEAANKFNNKKHSISITTYLDVQSGIAISKLKRRLYYLNVIVTMAPLLGLLGTISGMISAFSIFNLESGQAIAITGGVGEALIATAMGLCTAIIALAVHAYFTQRIDNIVTDMEQCFSLLEGALNKGSEA